MLFNILLTHAQLNILDTRTLSSLIKTRRWHNHPPFQISILYTILPRFGIPIASLNSFIFFLNQLTCETPSILKSNLPFSSCLMEQTECRVSKTSVKFGRIEFAFYPDLLELAQSSDYPVIKAQTFTQETYHGHQLSTYGK